MIRFSENLIDERSKEFLKAHPQGSSFLVDGFSALGQTAYHASVEGEHGIIPQKTLDAPAACSIKSDVLVTMVTKFTIYISSSAAARIIQRFILARVFRENPRLAEEFTTHLTHFDES